MTVTEASKKIGISNSKLYQLAAARRIVHYRVGGKIVFQDEGYRCFPGRLPGGCGDACRRHTCTSASS